MVSLLTTLKRVCVNISSSHSLCHSSGNENRNFYYKLDISTGKFVSECQPSLIFIENK